MTELERRYKEAVKIIRRLIAAYYREGWMDGETPREVIDEAQDFVSIEDLEKDLEDELKGST